MASDKPSPSQPLPDPEAQDIDSISLGRTKLQEEINKLRSENASLKLPWWRQPAYLATIIPLIGVAATAWIAYLNSDDKQAAAQARIEVGKLESEAVALRQKVQDLEQEKGMLRVDASPAHCVNWDPVAHLCHACEFAISAGNVGQISDVRAAPYICPNMDNGKYVEAEFVGGFGPQPASTPGPVWIRLFLDHPTGSPNDPEAHHSQDTDRDYPVWGGELKSSAKIENGKSEWRPHIDKCEPTKVCRVEGRLTVIEQGFQIRHFSN